MSQDAKLVILLVEDSDVMRKMEAKILAALGHDDIIEAGDGQKAVEVLQGEARVDLIISDWNMPHMDGYELLNWVRADQKRRETPFLMATAQAEKTQVEKAVGAGVSALVSKPFDQGELKGKIEACMAGLTQQAGAQSVARQIKVDDQGRVRLQVAHIQITDHLILGVLKHLIETGRITPKHFTLETQCQPGWNPVQESLENGSVDAAFILAPIGMDLFGYGVPVKLLLFAHKNGSIFVRNKSGDYDKDNVGFFRNKSFFIPHRLSIHHMLSHMYFSQLGLKPGVPGGEPVDVAFEVVPPIKMPEFLKQNSQAAGFMVAEPLGTKAIAGGIADLQFLSGEIWDQHPCCVVVGRDELVNQYPQATQEFINYLVEAGRFVARDPDRSAEIAVNFLDPQKKLGLTKNVLKNVLTEENGITTGDLYPVIDDLERMQEYMVGTMGVGKRVDLNAFVDPRFAEVACDVRQCEIKASAGIAMDKAVSLEHARAKERSDKARLATEGKYLTFHIGEEEYCINILKIREIIGMQPVTKPPQLPHFVKGIINLRGSIVPVIDLRARLGMEEIEYTERTTIIVVELYTDKGVAQMGVITDSVSEVINLKAEDISETPSFGASVETRYILGMALVGEKVKILLDIDKLLTDREADVLADF